MNSGVMGTTVTASFAGATMPSAVAYQAGTTGQFQKLALSGSSVSFTLPAGTSAYGFAYICPTFVAVNSYSNESILQATTADTTSLSLNCPSLSGNISATFDVSAIPGATSTLFFEGYWSDELYATSGVQSLSGVPSGTFDVALVAIGANGALAIQIQRGVNVTSSTSIAFPPMTAADEVGSAPASITNVPSGATSSGFETTYQTSGGLSVILPAPFDGLPQSTYPTVPSSQSQSGDFYLIHNRRNCGRFVMDSVPDALHGLQHLHLCHADMAGDERHLYRTRPFNADWLCPRSAKRRARILGPLLHCRYASAVQSSAAVGNRGS